MERRTGVSNHGNSVLCWIAFPAEFQLSVNKLGMWKRLWTRVITAYKTEAPLPPPPKKKVPLLSMTGEDSEDRHTPNPVPAHGAHVGQAKGADSIPAITQPGLPGGGCGVTWELKSDGDAQVAQPQTALNLESGLRFWSVLSVSTFPEGRTHQLQTQPPNALKLSHSYF